MSKRSVPLHLGEVIQRVPLFFSTGPRACRIPADPTTDDHLRTRPDRARERIEWHEECLEAHANAERTPREERSFGPAHLVECCRRAEVDGIRRRASVPHELGFRDRRAGQRRAGPRTPPPLLTRPPP